MQLYNEAYDGWKTNGFPAFSVISRRYLSRTITCSEHLRQWLIERGGHAERIGVVKLGINTTHFPFTDDHKRQRAKGAILGLNSSVLVLASSSHLDNQKRSALLPEIVAEVKKRLPLSCGLDVVMIIMGDGPLRQKIVDKIRVLGLTRNIILAGNVEDPVEILRGSDIFLLPSVMEGISTAVAEAMSLGLPVVTSNVGGLPEQLGDQGNGHAAGGRLVNVTSLDDQDVKAYADAILDLACDRGQRVALGVTGRKFVESTFDELVSLPRIMHEFDIARRAAPRHALSDPVSCTCTATTVSEMRLILLCLLESSVPLWPPRNKLR